MEKHAVAKIVVEDMAGLKSLLGRDFRRYVRRDRGVTRKLIALATDADNPISRSLASCLRVAM